MNEGLAQITEQIQGYINTAVNIGLSVMVTVITLGIVAIIFYIVNKAAGVDSPFGGLQNALFGGNEGERSLSEVNDELEERVRQKRLYKELYD